MVTFLDYDFASIREAEYAPQDFHSILEIPQDNEKRQTDPYESSEEDESPLQVSNEQYQETLYISHKENQTDANVKSEQNQTVFHMDNELNQTVLSDIKEENQTASFISNEQTENAFYMDSAQNQTEFLVVENNQTALYTNIMQNHTAHDTINSSFVIPVNTELDQSHKQGNGLVTVDLDQNYTPHTDPSVLQEEKRNLTFLHTHGLSPLDIDKNYSPVSTTRTSINYEDN